MAKVKKSDDNTPQSDEGSFFLGVLRSEFDTPDVLDAGWVQLVNVAEALKESYLRHELSPIETAKALSEVKLSDGNGYEWTVGASSGEWYKRTLASDKWLKTNPPYFSQPLESDKLWVKEGVRAFIKKNDSEMVLPDSLMPSGPFSESSDEDILSSLIDAEKTPVARENSVQLSDLVGWQPMAREDGPELEPFEPREEVVSEEVKTRFGYESLLDDFKEEIEPKEAKAEDKGSESEDDLDLPQDLFYRPE